MYLQLISPPWTKQRINVRQPCHCHEHNLPAVTNQNVYKLTTQSFLIWRRKSNITSCETGPSTKQQTSHIKREKSDRLATEHQFCFPFCECKPQKLIMCKIFVLNLQNFQLLSSQRLFTSQYFLFLYVNFLLYREFATSHNGDVINERPCLICFTPCNPFLSAFNESSP